jgi:hypothetical protein
MAVSIEHKIGDACVCRVRVPLFREFNGWLKNDCRTSGDHCLHLDELLEFAQNLLLVLR